MDFNSVLEVDDFGRAVNPFASKREGEWQEGYIYVDFLNTHFGHLETAEEMINETDSEGLKLYFAWLRDKGILN